MDGVDAPTVGESGGDGGLFDGESSGEGSGWAYRFLAIPALLMRRSI